MSDNDSSLESGAVETGSTGSKVFVILTVVCILIGVIAWNAFDYLEHEGLDPKKIKAMANEYDGECYALTKDEKACKRHIGMHHRECLKDSVVRPEPGSGDPVVYDHTAYAECMRVYQAEDLADYLDEDGAIPTK